MRRRGGLIFPTLRLVLWCSLALCRCVGGGKKSELREFDSEKKFVKGGSSNARTRAAAAKPPYLC